MTPEKKDNIFKKATKIVLRILLLLFILLLIGGILLSLPTVQTKIAKYATKELNKEFGTNFQIEKASISIFGGVKLKNILVLDHKKDTLFFIKQLQTHITNYTNLINGDLNFGTIKANELTFNLVNYKNENETNLDKFVACFDDGKPSKSKKKFLLTAQNIELINSNFKVVDYTLNDPKVFSVKKLHTKAEKFQVLGPDVTMKIKDMQFVDNRNLEVTQLQSDFTYTKKNILLKKLLLQTPYSKLNGNVALKYNREDFSDFNNKVIFDIKLNKSSISTNDLKLFYGEFGKNKIFNVKTHLVGTLNNFSTNNLKLFDNKQSKIIGDFTFKNLFAKNKNSFFMKGNIENIESNYADLISILPKILGNNLPSSFKKLGNFSLSGQTEVTLKSIDADIILISVLGKTVSNLSMTNIDNIDNATYKGNVELNNFALGKLINRKDIGIVNLVIEVDGKGFTEKYLKTKLKGEIQSAEYNKYNYKNIVVDGNMNKAVFDGIIQANDPNLKMNFEGVLDLSKKTNEYNFNAQVEYANLKKLNIYTTDSLAEFKGNVYMKLKGNTIDNLFGEVKINNTSFKNGKNNYIFKDFEVDSFFDENQVRTININSPDIISGKIKGIFQFNQIVKLVENSLGSLYANYSANKVNKGQFIDFDFKVHNQFIEIFYPEISIAENTQMKGSINSNTNDFKLNFKSPKIEAFSNLANNIDIKIDNKNPLYNAYISLDSLKTKHYKISDFSLINVTANDTLFFRTEFKGGKKAKDYYNLNLYHTINEENNSVVGIKKSEINFKDYLWFLNENESNDNKIIFNKKLTDFSIEKIGISHENEKMELAGILRDSTYKDLKLSFNNVNLEKITPAIDSLKFNGRVNGAVNFKQNNSIYEPSSTVTVNNLKLNNFELGKLDLLVTGDDTFKNFKLESSLKNNNIESFKANGNINFENKNTYLDLLLQLDDFNLAAFSPLGGDVIKNIRGLASGTTKLEGEIKDPDIIGRLYLNQAGLTIPYLNTDYNFKSNSVVDVTENQFSFRRIEITDSKYKTEGVLDGTIRHSNFGNWMLDLDISSDRLLALDTKDADNVLYYGTAFINGNATIKGLTNALFIDVNAKSAKGTSIKIPINDSESKLENDFIKFKTPQEKFSANYIKPKIEKTANGIELNFNLDVNREAEVEIILDKNTGHGIKTKAFSGNLQMEINTLGKFKMYGDYVVDNGEYNFKYGGVIDKKFQLKEGGSISWNGDPLDATLNIEAIYKTEANPAVLLENPSFNRKIPTEVIIKLTDKLANPNPDVNINFPTLSSVLKSELDYKLSDNDTRQTQAFALLSSGSFTSNSAVGEGVVTGNLLERASSLFDDLVGGNDNKFKVGLGYIQGSGRNSEFETDGRVIATLSTQLNDKITVNGSLGVPVGGVNESVVVGNVEIQMQLNEDGSLKARVFNRENDVTYIGEGVGFTQGLGLSYEVDFNTFRELLRKIVSSSKKKNQQNKQNDQSPDSDLTPEFVRFAEERQKKNAEKPKAEPKKEEVPEVIE